MQAMPLFFGLTPSAYQSRVLQVLVEDIRKHENHFTLGFLGTTFAAEVLARAGEHDLLYEVLTQLDFPFHGRILDAGATTITEAWNAFLGVDFASHNHANSGAVAGWFLRWLAEISPEFAP